LQFSFFLFFFLSFFLRSDELKLVGVTTSLNRVAVPLIAFLPLFPLPSPFFLFLDSTPRKEGTTKIQGKLSCLQPTIMLTPSPSLSLFFSFPLFPSPPPRHANFKDDSEKEGVGTDTGSSYTLHPLHFLASFLPSPPSFFFLRGVVSNSREDFGYEFPTSVTLSLTQTFLPILSPFFFSRLAEIRIVLPGARGFHFRSWGIRLLLPFSSTFPRYIARV